MAQKYTEARKEGNRKWDAANLDRLSIALPKGSRETIKAHATAQGESANAFIKRAIDGQMERDGSQQTAGTPVGAGGYLYPLTHWEPHRRRQRPRGMPRGIRGKGGTDTGGAGQSISEDGH